VNGVFSLEGVRVDVAEEITGSYTRHITLKPTYPAQTHTKNQYPISNSNLNLKLVLKLKLKPKEFGSVYM
jgi:hypothetical protein